jgi:hypothetical protein
MRRMLPGISSDMKANASHSILLSNPVLCGSGGLRARFERVGGVDTTFTKRSCRPLARG